MIVCGRTVRTCACITKPSLAMRPTGLMEQRVKARDSGPSVTLEMVYSVSSTCMPAHLLSSCTDLTLGYHILTSGSYLLW